MVTKTEIYIINILNSSLNDDDKLIIFIALGLIILVSVILVISGQKQENQDNSYNNYLGGYDGGHNNYDSTNIVQSTGYDTASNDQTQDNPSKYYMGGYDGGHNNLDSINTFKKYEYEKSSSEQILRLESKHMHDIRNLTISSTNPCLLIYLIDQSFSMAEEFGNASHPKSLEVSNAINDILYEVGLRCIGQGGMLKNRFEIAVIGYGKQLDNVQSGWEGQLSGKWVVSVKNIFEYPLDQINDKPVWINPYAVGNTPMTKAFENAKRLCNDWINWGNHRDCHPPIIINITDGEASDAGKNFNLLYDQVKQIKSLRTNYGFVNILNIHISTRSGDKLLFPNQVNSGDKFEKLLFEMSTPLDENMVRIAHQKGYDIRLNAKGYVFNGSATDLINFLNIGTPQ